MVSTTKTETACRSIEVTDYDVLAAGDVTMQAPIVSFDDTVGDVSVDGSLTVITLVP